MKKDLIGMTFNDLTIIGSGKGRRRSDGRMNRTWICECMCGRQVELPTNAITSGNTKSCGCRRKRSRHKTDLTGRTFSDLTVLKRAEDLIIGEKRKPAWICRCSCGTRTTVRQDGLMSGFAKSCGCHRKNLKNKRKKDLTGEVFGLLTVLKEGRTHTTKSGQKVPYWHCACSCGNIVEVRGSCLKSGSTKSCGCYRSQNLSNAKTIDLTGQLFGELTAVERTKGSQNRHSMWLCRCKCGNFKEVNSDSLRSGHTKSCGCLGKSSGEHYISQLLIKNNVSFVREYYFKNLFRVEGFPLRFDFAIFNSKNDLLCLIEFQGEQHYVEKKYDFGTLQRKTTDSMKKEYCKRNNIKLCEIKFDEDIEKSLLIVLESCFHANPVLSSKTKAARSVVEEKV